jgi:hypothetical protein
MKICILDYGLRKTRDAYFSLWSQISVRTSDHSNQVSQN